MTGVVELAAAAVGLLAPYVAKGAEELATKFGGEVASRIVTLYDKVKAKLTGGAAKEALAELEAKPDDARRKAALELQLEKALEADPSFRDEVGKLLGEIEAKGGRDAISQVMTVSGGSKGAQIAGDKNKITM